MKIDFYVQCRDTADAMKMIDRLALQSGDRWAEPITHPFRKTRLVPWNEEFLQDYAEIIEGHPRLTLDQAMKSGFNLGYHRGKFAQSDRKIEEARFTLEMLPLALEAANFPACRALFYAVQSSLYSMREALKKTCIRISPEGNCWCTSAFMSIKKNEPFIDMLNVDYNRDKHNESSGILIPNLKLYSYKGAAPDYISGEGVFSVEGRDTDRQRRVFHPAVECMMSIRIDFQPISVSGEDLGTLNIVQQLFRVVNFYEDLIFDAKQKFGN